MRVCVYIHCHHHRPQTNTTPNADSKHHTAHIIIVNSPSPLHIHTYITSTQHNQAVYLVNSGSEANDLALRIARAAAAAKGRLGARDVAVVGGAYHGTTTAAMAMR